MVWIVENFTEQSPIRVRARHRSQVCIGTEAGTIAVALKTSTFWRYLTPAKPHHPMEAH